jgi:hypothetical protein
MISIELHGRRIRLDMLYDENIERDFTVGIYYFIYTLYTLLYTEYLFNAVQVFPSVHLLQLTFGPESSHKNVVTLLCRLRLVYISSTLLL